MPDLPPAWLNLPLPPGWQLDEENSMLLDEFGVVVVYWDDDREMFRAVVNDAILAELDDYDDL